MCKKCNNIINDDCFKCPYCGEILIKKDEGLITIEEESVDGVNIYKEKLIEVNSTNNNETLDKTKTISIIDVEDISNIEEINLVKTNSLLEQELKKSETLIDVPNNTIVLPNVIGNKDIENKKQPKKKLNFLFSSILLLIIVTLIAGGSYIYILSMNKSIMFKSFTTVTNKIGNLIKNNNFNNVSNIDSNYLKTNLNVSFLNEGLNEFVNLDNTKFNAEIITNKSGDEVNIESNIVDNNENIFISTIIKDNKIYNLVKDVYNTYYYKNFINGFNMENTLTIKDYEYIIKLVSKNINDNIDNKDFFTSKEKIKVLDKEENVKKISYEITEKKIKEISIKVLENILNDNKSLNILVKSSGKDLESLKKIINEELIELKNNNDIDKVRLFYNMFVTGINNIVKYEVVIDESEKNNISVLALEVENNVCRLKIDTNSKTILILDFNNIEEGKTEFNGNLDILKINGNLISQDKINKLYIEIDTLEINKGVVININNRKDVSNNLIKHNLNGSILIKSGLLLNEKDIKFAINIYTNTVGVQEIPNVNLSKSLEHNNISLEETEKFKNKIYELPVVKSFYSLFSGLTNKKDASNDDFINNNESLYYTTNVNMVK